MPITTQSSTETPHKCDGFHRHRPLDLNQRRLNGLDAKRLAQVVDTPATESNVPMDQKLSVH